MNEKDYIEKLLRNKILEENENYYQNLLSGLDCLNICGNILKNDFKIDIFQTPWYKNILDIYVPQAFDFYQKSKDFNFNIADHTSVWMRSFFKSFISEIEKFVKFITANLLHLKPNSFSSAINNLKRMYEDYKQYLNNLEKTMIFDIVDNLHRWRKAQNKNKHEHNHLDSNWYTEGKRILYSIGFDILEFTSDSIYRIISQLLLIMINILKKR